MTTIHPAPFPPDFYTKTLTNITNLRQEYDHNDTLHRFLGDAEAAIGNLIVLNDETKKERDEARAAETLQSDRDRHARDVEIMERALGATPIEDAFTAAKRVVRERDEARAALNSGDGLLCAALDAAIKEREEARAGSHARKRLQDELDTAIKSRDIAISSEARLIKERDDARNARDAANERARDWSTRYEALFAQSTHLAREVDRLKNEKADRLEANADEPKEIKVGDLVRWRGRGGKVFALFVAHNGVEFLAVESDGTPHFWPVSEVFQ